MKAAPPPIAVQCFGPALALGLARVPADPSGHAALAAAWLCGEEHTRCARFQVDHARADFLAGRIAGKSATCALASQLHAPAGWTIAAGENQRPLLAHVLPGHGVTLAHAGGAGLAAVHDAQWRCGVDLELLERDADAAIATQVTPAEAAWARAGGARERERWLLLWTAREAQGKSLGTGLLQPEQLAATEAWTAAESGWRAQFAGDATVTVRSVVAGGFVATVVLPRAIDVEPIAAWLAGALL